MNEATSYNRIDRALRKYEAEIAAQYKIALDKTRIKLAAIYEKYTVAGELTYGQMAKYGRLAKLEKDLMAYFTASNTLVVSSLKRLPKEMIAQAYKEFAYQFDNGLGTRLSWGTIPTKAVADIIANPLDLIARDSLTIRQRSRIKTALAQGFLQGQGYPEMAAGIKDVYGKTAYEAMRVARTEGQRSAVAAQRAVYDKTESIGIETALFWDAITGDGRTRENHGIENETKAQEHEGTLMFFYKPTGQWVTGPMSSNLPAGDVINCRCRIRQELVEMPDDINTSHPKTSYKKWEETQK